MSPRYFGLPSTLLIAATAVIACVAPPFEHTNYYDPVADTRITILGAPDSLMAVSESFTLSAVSTPDWPAGVGGPTWEVIAGSTMLQSLGGSTWRTTSAIGLLPSTAIIRIHVYPLETPWDTVHIVMRQRPAAISLDCVVGFPCATLALGTSTTLRFRLWDTNNFIVNLGVGPFRFGTVESRDPSVVEVAGRPSTPSITLLSHAPGSVWIVLSGEGLSDSVQVTVPP